MRQKAELPRAEKQARSVVPTALKRLEDVGAIISNNKDAPSIPVPIPFVSRPE